jgi:hypothetical protein
LIIVAVIVFCILQRNQEIPGDAAKNDVTSGDVEMSAPPPTYFFGIETTPKYRAEKPIYPSLPDFSDAKSVKGTTVGRSKSIRNSSSKTPDVIPAYSSLTLTPVDDATNYDKLYSDNIFVNPELSYWVSYLMFL